MNFLAAPWLLTALLAAVVVLLHAHRKHRLEVPSLMLWRALALPPGTRRSRRRWPPVTLPLVLQIGAVLLAALALALPYLSNRRVPDHLVLVLDGSAGMEVAEAGGTRFDLARDRIAALLDAAGDVAPRHVSLVLAGPEARPVAARWRGEAALFAPVLERLSAEGAPADWAGAARLVSGLVNPGEDTRVLLLSDAAPDPALAAAAPGIEAERIGTDLPRADLTVTVTRGVTTGEWQYVAEARFHGGLEAATLTVGYADGPGVTPLPWAERALEADDAGRDRVTQTVTLPGPGILSFAIDGRTEARFVVDAAAGRARLLYIGPGEQPLVQALQAQPGVEFYQADALPADLSGFAAVILDRVAVDRVPEVPALWIADARVAGDPEPPVLTAPDPDDWSDTHPLARALDWTRLAVAEARDAAPAPGAEVLVAADGRPLLTAREGPGARQVRLAFDPAATNWPGTPDLALFAGAALDFLGVTPGDEVPLSCTVAVPCAVPGLTPGTVLTAEDGTETVVPPGGFLPRRAGLFGFAGIDGPALVAVNAADVPAAAPADGAGPARLARGWTFWLVAGAFLCIAGDTVLAGRRRGRFGLPPVIGIVATLLALAALVPLPAPHPAAARQVVVVGGAEGDGPARIAAGPAPALGHGLPVATGPLEQAGAALALAAATVPPATEGRLVLTGDPATRPAAAEIAALSADLSARGSGLRIDHIAPLPLVPGEIVLHPPGLPPAALSGEPVRMTLRIAAGAPVETMLRIFRDGTEIAAEPVTLDAGANRVETVIPPAATNGADGALIEVALDPVGGDDPENNRAARWLPVPPPRPVAVIAAAPEHGAAMANLLAAEGLTADVMAPGDMPQYLRDWLGYGGAVLLNTPAITMTVRQQEILAQAVGEQGLGLLILGGENAFGPGGYFETPIEDLSPLSAKVPRDAPEVGMVFVLDRSGSMQQPVAEGTRLDVAKRATLSAIDLLNPQSQIGIVVFDAEAQAVLPFQPLDRAAAERALDGVDPGGGTAIHPGLVAAFEMLRGTQSPARHVIVMTDGLSQPGDWPTIIGELRGLGATVSAVAIGQGSDSYAVEVIAALGGGAAHVTTDFEALPSILSQEAMMFSAPLEEGPSQPVWRDTALPFLSGLPNPMPPVEGFVLTTAKDEARVLLTTPDTKGEDAPLMAWWRYGNGQVLAFASDATGPWTANWHAMPGYGALWADALRAFQPLTPGPGLSLSAEGDGERLIATLTALDRDGAGIAGLSPRATLTAPDGAATEVTMRPAGPGTYAAHLPLGGTGRYEVTVPGEGDAPLSAVWHHSWPVALDPARGAGGADWLGMMTGGGEIAPAEAEAGPGLAWVLRADFRPWLILALAALMIELVRRYAEFPGLRRRAAAPMPEPAVAVQGGPT